MLKKSINKNALFFVESKQNDDFFSYFVENYF